MRLKTRGRRRGYLLAEAVAAGVLLALAMLMTVRLLAWVASERRAAERRGWAVQEAANVMDRLAAIPYDRLTPGAAAEVANRSRESLESLPDAEVVADVRDEQDPPMKRIDVVVRWRGHAGLGEAPVRVSHWVARKGARP